MSQTNSLSNNDEALNAMVSNDDDDDDQQRIPLGQARPTIPSPLIHGDGVVPGFDRVVDMEERVAELDDNYLNQPGILDQLIAGEAIDVHFSTGTTLVVDTVNAGLSHANDIHSAPIQVNEVTVTTVIENQIPHGLMGETVIPPTLAATGDITGAGNVIGVHPLVTDEPPTANAVPATTTDMVQRENHLPPPEPIITGVIAPIGEQAPPRAHASLQNTDTRLNLARELGTSAITLENSAHLDETRVSTQTNKRSSSTNGEPSKRRRASIP